MNSVLVIILSLLFVPYKICKSSNPQIVEVPFAEEKGPGMPLFLTPLIESGKIDEARAKAAVRHRESDVTSYSGYLTVNKEYNSNLFFWFFPALITSHLLPVVLWLQGGPGHTSMFGLFAEHGPFSVTSNLTLEVRRYTWITYNNVIYIDSPVGTGYSFTDNKKGYARNVTQVARDLYTVLVQFFLLFPKLQTNDFFVTGESYAGKYVIALSHAIIENNINAETKINLKGLAIGNGFCDPENQLFYSDYLYQIGLIDLNGKVEFERYEQATYQFIKANNFSKAFENYNKLFGSGLHKNLSLFYNLTGFNFDFHFSNANVDDDKYYHSLSFFGKWILRNDVRYAIHVGSNTFNLTSSIVYEHLKKDYLQSVIDLLKDILEDNKFIYRVLIYNGQLDIVNAYPLTENYLQKMEWFGADKYAKAPRKFWMIDDVLAGYTKNAYNLRFVIVRNAGRMVSTDQPKWALDLITRFTNNEEDFK